MTTSIVFSPSARHLRGNNADDNFSYVLTETPVGAAPIVTTAASFDATIESSASSGIKNNCTLTVGLSLINPNKSVSFSSLNTGFATVNDLGEVKYVANGTVNIKIKAGGLEQTFTRVMTSAGAVTTTRVTGYRNDSPGSTTNPSLGRHVTDAMDAMLLGKTPAGNETGFNTSQSMWSANNYEPTTANTAVKNPNFFAASLSDKLLAIAVGSNSGGVASSAHTPVLVTPRHIVSADHFHVAVGTPIAFMRPDGTKQVVTVVSGANVPYATGKTADQWIGYLSAPVDAVIAPMKIMPTDWAGTYFKSQHIIEGSSFLARGLVPLLVKVRKTPNGLTHDRICVARLSRTDYLTATAAYTWCLIPSGYVASGWEQPAVGGDSGGAIMMVVNGDPVLLTTFYQARGGVDLAQNSVNLEATMNSLATSAGGDAAAGTYAFTRAVLTGFTAY